LTFSLKSANMDVFPCRGDFIMKQTIKKLFSPKNRAVTYLALPFTIAILTGFLPLFGSQTQSAEADFKLEDFNLPVLLSTIQSNSLLPISSDGNPVVAKVITAVLTAYSSTVEETDDTPFTTASNTIVRDGIVANNLLPFGTKIRIPEIFGDKTFVVEDRMHARKSDYHVDIWFSSHEQAEQFGARIAKVEVID
jgi:3D (Asp-Asp-Asp) domain-containing protein